MLVLAANFFYKTLTWKEFKVHNSLFDKIYFIFFPEQTVKHFQVVTLELLTSHCAHFLLISLHIDMLSLDV